MGLSDEKSNALNTCKGNHYSLGFWIPHCEFPDSKAQNFTFQEQKSAELWDLDDLTWGIMSILF